MRRFAPLVLAWMVALATSAGARPADLVRSIQVFVPAGHDAAEAHSLVRPDEGLPLTEDLVERHVDTLGDLGWVDAVDVDIHPTSQDDQYDVVYQLSPRGRVFEIRIEGNEAMTDGQIEQVVASQRGLPFNLKQALADAHAINLLYQEAGFSFSGILDSQNVDFRHGVLTFKVREAQLERSDRQRLEQALGTTIQGPLRRNTLGRYLAEGDLKNVFDLDTLEVDVDRRSGVLRVLPGQRTSPSGE